MMQIKAAAEGWSVFQMKAPSVDHSHLHAEQVCSSETTATGPGTSHQQAAMPLAADPPPITALRLPLPILPPSLA